ncbi:MAG: HigA family addiction module antidote protein [Alphaproteobacteria bacterium GM202ARS2]|nr:HigA family addiction module antidote protein [Alphaproteobacteria bacterium GM202ARS2]
MLDEEQQTSWKGQEPPHPAELLKDVLRRRGVSLTQDELADRLGVSRGTVNRLLRQRQELSAEMAIRLERLTGIGADSWIAMQNSRDLFLARRELGDAVSEIEPLPEYETKVKRVAKRGGEKS